MFLERLHIICNHVLLLILNFEVLLADCALQKNVQLILSLVHLVLGA